MTVIVAGQHAWMPAYCTGCERLVHFQKEDVQKMLFTEQTPAQTMAGATGSPVVAFVVRCKCGHDILVART